MNEVLRCIKTRRSTKAYLDTPVEWEKLELILEAGTYAPTGRNLQAPIMIAVTDRKLRDRLSRMNAEIMGASGDPFYNAPAVIVVLAEKRARTYVYDGSVVMENLQLAAHSLGLGCCWIHRAKEMFESEEGKEILRELGINSEVEGIGNCIIGYPASAPAEPKPRKENYIYRVK